MQEINTSSKAKGAVRMHVFHSILKHLNAGILNILENLLKNELHVMLLQSAHWIK